MTVMAGWGAGWWGLQERSRLTNLYSLLGPEANGIPRSAWDSAENLPLNQDSWVSFCLVMAEAGGQGYPERVKNSPGPFALVELRLFFSLPGLARSWGCAVGLGRQ